MTISAFDPIDSRQASRLSSFIETFLPLQYIPPHQTTKDNWITGNNTLFNSQWVQCSYPISGSYGPTPRYVYYALIVLALIARRSTWLAKAALGSVMIYSATAAVHAIVFVAVRTKMAPASVVDPGPYQVILAEGISQSGEWNYTIRDGLWLPVLPMAWDNDADPIVAIVGTAFLILQPMRLWSATFKSSEAKTLLSVWGLLLFVGTVCALISQAYTILWAFPQLRFCPPGQNDSLPLTNGGSSNISMPPDGSDIYYWNWTIYDYFQTNQSQTSNVCQYPCFATTWPLRDPTDIMVLDSSLGQADDSPSGFWAFFAVYLVIGTTLASSLTILIIDGHRHWRNKSSNILYLDFLRRSGGRYQSPSQASEAIANDGPVDYKQFSSYLKRPQSALLQWSSKLAHLWWRVVNLYVRFLSPPVVIFFVGWVEWHTWNSDPPGESFRHVGQWGALVAILLAVGAAILDHLVGKLRTRAVAGELPAPA